MPTVLRVGGFAIGFYAKDHEPPHVHVRRSGKEAVVDLLSGEVRKIRGMNATDVSRAQLLVEAHQDELLSAWRQWHSPEESV